MPLTRLRRPWQYAALLMAFIIGVVFFGYLNKGAAATEAPAAQLSQRAESLQVQDIEPPPATTEAPPGAIALPPETPVDIVLDWFPGPQHAALIVAEGLGLFRQRGLTVRLSTPADPDVPPKLVAASRVTLAITDQPTLHRLVDEGKPLVRVATLVELPMAALIARKSTGIKSSLSLIDHRIGYSRQTSYSVLMRAILQKEGLNLSHVEPRDVHFSVIPAMSEKRIDAVIDGQRFGLPRQLADLGVATQVIPVERLGIPIHDGLILVANRNHYAVQHDAIRRLVNALGEADRWILDHPNQAWDMLVEREPSINTAANAEAWPHIRSRLSLRPGAVDMARYRRMERFLWEQNIIGNQTPPDQLAIDPG
ncbi:ABC transporter substrate-binding protein [Halomonas binhaiensis]|uniref:ABC transporter substrate-binding protein n=1 Tax=Halomonas binhaiensis TaxID=2562282 RepID=A0A5C1NFM7_9GAMM|nr:ABC transporter substrate-binding protein [Halomonas binhaiensis]QEM81670.1 ABC transporter substrate-binding protein [Halomonas binhaiensis]